MLFFNKSDKKNEANPHDSANLIVGIQDDLQTSHTILKKALALMVQYKIPATPLHYAVWYTYVSEGNSYIVEAINDSIKNNGFVTEVMSEQLYHKFIATQNEKSSAKIKLGFENMVHNVTGQIKDTISYTSSFNKRLNKHFALINSIKANKNKQTIEKMMEGIEGLYKCSEDLEEFNLEFMKRLDESHKKIKRLEKEISLIQVKNLYDAVTEVLNQRAFEQDITNLVSMRRGFSLVLAELDNFALITENYGNRISDTVIKTTAKVLVDKSKPAGQVYRLSSNIMGIIYPNTPMHRARASAEQCRRYIEHITIKERIRKLNQADVTTQQSLSQISASFGVAEYKSQGTVEEIITKTQEFLNHAIQNGRNRVMPITVNSEWSV